MRFFQAILVTALLVVCAMAHPISMSHAVVNVRETEALVELKIMLEDLVMFHGLKADKTTCFAAKDLRQALDMVLTTVPEEALRYGGVPGFEGLREALAERMSPIDSVPMTLDNFVITNGSAGGIDTVCDAFVEPGDVVIIEGPTFSGSTRTFRGHSAEIVQVPVDDDGIVVGKAAEVMERAKASGKRVKLVYVISDFHNPTGVAMSSERRKALVQLCAEHQVLIVEDAAYAEIHFGQNRPDSLYGLAGGQGILKVGTFSKPIATGLSLPQYADFSV